MTARDDTFTHIARFADGEMHISADGSFVTLKIWVRGARTPLTINLSPTTARRAFARGSELVPYAEAFRSNRGSV